MIGTKRTQEEIDLIEMLHMAVARLRALAGDHEYMGNGGPTLKLASELESTCTRLVEHELELRPRAP